MIKRVTPPPDGAPGARPDPSEPLSRRGIDWEFVGVALFMIGLTLIALAIIFR